MTKPQGTLQDAKRPVERLVMWLMTGFPSPWRWIRRTYWGYRWNSLPKEMFSLPCRTVTDNPSLAAAIWAEAFYEARDTLEEMKSALDKTLKGKPIRNCDELYLRVQRTLELGEQN